MSGFREVRQPTAIEFGIALVAARSWTQKKMRERLATRYSAAEVEEALARLRELRLVDDAAWAERFVRERFERGGKGRHRIRSELLVRGIDAPTAEAALAAVVDGDTERDKAAAVLDAMRARLGRVAGRPGDEAQLPSPDTDAAAAKPFARGAARPARAPETLRNRLFRRMIARGYPADLVRDLLDVS